MKHNNAKSSMKSTDNKTAFKIESGIPVPVVLQGQLSPFPWDLLKVGESFFVPNGKLASLKANCYQRSRPNGLKLRAFPVEGGVRVWRLE
jgi:hypothetical protein